MTNDATRATATDLPEEDDFDFGSLDFEPWVHEPGGWSPPSNDEWVKMVNPDLIILRLCWLTVHKSKLELTKIVHQMEQEGILEELMQRAGETEDLFQAMITVLRGAQARIFCVAEAERQSDGQDGSHVT